jgi:gluconolactonase
VSVWREPSGCDDAASVSTNRGSNGMTLDRQGRVVICEHGNRRVTRTEPDGRITVLATHYEGKRLNSPNDIVVKSDGSIYFTDPPYGFDTEDEDPRKELDHNSVYRLDETGKVTRLSPVLNRPNGLAFSPDERFLFVDNSERMQMVWMRYPVAADGTLDSGDVFYYATDREPEGVPDGFRIDAKGTMYCTGPGGILVIDAAGKYMGTVPVPEVTANCVWGDADGKSLYVTATTSIYRIRGLE